jgi:hypothetical protein
MRILLATCFALTSLIFCGSTQAENIRFATGYPSLEATDGMAHINNFVDLGFIGNWAANVFQLNITRPASIEMVRGVGSQMAYQPVAWQDFGATLRVFSSLSAFEASPLSGDVVNANLTLQSTEPFGFTDFGGYPNHLVNLNVQGDVSLNPGTYWVAVEVQRGGLLWAWQESAINLGSAYQVLDVRPEPYHLLNEFPDFYTTATPAIDLIGTVVPAPSAVSLLMATGAVLGLRRRRS